MTVFIFVFQIQVYCFGFVTETYFIFFLSDYLDWLLDR